MSEVYNLKKYNFFKYLQIRSWIQSQTKNHFPWRSEESLLEKCLFDSRYKGTEGLIYVAYKTVTIYQLL